MLNGAYRTKSFSISANRVQIDGLDQLSRIPLYHVFIVDTCSGLAPSLLVIHAANMLDTPHFHISDSFPSPSSRFRFLYTSISALLRDQESSPRPLSKHLDSHTEMIERIRGLERRGGSLGRQNNDGLQTPRSAFDFQRPQEHDYSQTFSRHQGRRSKSMMVSHPIFQSLPQILLSNSVSPRPLTHTCLFGHWVTAAVLGHYVIHLTLVQRSDEYSCTNISNLLRKTLHVE
jgi:hypothetical protein